MGTGPRQTPCFSDSHKEQDRLRPPALTSTQRLLPKHTINEISLVGEYVDTTEMAPSVDRWLGQELGDLNNHDLRVEETSPAAALLPNRRHSGAARVTTRI